jgi:hypothetical protein
MKGPGQGYPVMACEGAPCMFFLVSSDKDVDGDLGDGSVGQVNREMRKNRQSHTA